MGRAPCCDKANVKKGAWSPEEDEKLKEYIQKQKHGAGGNWIALPQKAGLRRCGKSCRLRWLNYLRPNIKHGEFSDDEDRIIFSLFDRIGSRWSVIAAQLPGRTDNDIKNYWNTKLKKKLTGAAPVISSQYPKNPLSFDNYLLQNPSISYHHAKNTFNFTTPIRVFSRSYHEPSFNTHMSSNSTVLQVENGFMGPTHGDYNRVSCSSSDGSFIINQISHDVKVDHDHSLGLQSYNFSDNNDQLKAENGCFSENPDQDYNTIEEIKQLISSNNMCNNLNFLVDEIKTEDQLLNY